MIVACKECGHKDWTSKSGKGWFCKICGKPYPHRNMTYGRK